MHPFLDNVPWAGLHHAYGSASDTPGHLQALRDPSDEAFDQAMDALWASICHQGSVYEASGYAVPFLVALLDIVSEPRRERLILFLAELASHGVYASRDREIFTDDDFRHIWESPDGKSPNVRYTYQDFIDEGNEHYEARWTQLTHERVGENLPQMLAMWPQLGPVARCCISARLLRNAARCSCRYCNRSFTTMWHPWQKSSRLCSA